MSKQQYEEKRFHHHSARMILVINAMIEKYLAAGLRLTARQIYYQLVAHHGLVNSERSYRNTTRLINDAKLAGLMDWDAIEDRTRAFIKRSRWASGAEILDASARGFHMDMWKDQDVRPFVVIEKEALVGVLERVCSTYDVPLLAARGYPSGSVLREFCVQDVLPAFDDSQGVVVIHLGDHDPSGIDMTRDLNERIALFSENANSILVDRIALSMNQIKAHKPPPNPAKQTDARFKEYAAVNKTTDSWELDALDPDFLAKLVEKRIQQEIDTSRWNKRLNQIKRIKAKITRLARGFNA